MDKEIPVVMPRKWVSKEELLDLLPNQLNLEPYENEKAGEGSGGSQT